MSFSTLMVHLDLVDSSDAPLRVAADLAERFDTRVIGTSAGFFQPLCFMEGAAAQEILEKERADLLSEMAAKERLFREVLKHRAAKIEWRSKLGWPADFVAQEARAADLLIVGAAGDHDGVSRKIDAGEIVLRAGRPVLVVPEQIE